MGVPLKQFISGWLGLLCAVGTGGGPLLASQPTPEPAKDAASKGTTVDAPSMSEKKQNVKVLLLAGSEALTPGESALLLLRFEIRPHWHMYWNGQNDTGLAPTWTPREWPAGFAIEAAGWPGPTRHVLPGDIRDHIYEGTLGIVLQVRVSKDAKPGTSVTLPLHVEWMVCDTMCVLEEQDVSVTVPIVAASADRVESSSGRAARAEIQKVRAAIPRGATLASEATSRASARVEGNTLLLRVHGASEVQFFPALDAAEPSSPIEGTTATGDSLAVAFADAAHVGRAAGVVASRSSSTASWEYDWVDLRAAKSDAAADPTPTVSDPTGQFQKPTREPAQDSPAKPRGK